MANYFNYFPKTFYSNLESSTYLDLVTNLISRASFQESLKSNLAAYYKYDIQDSDTPEIIASKIYGSPEKHWVILLLNDIIDPQYDWPLEYRTLVNYIDKKYTPNANVSIGENGLQWSQSNIHSYYKVKTKKDSLTNTEDVKKIQVDANTYANVSVTTTSYTLQNGTSITVDITKETLTFYDYELEENEKKRTIKILKPEFVSVVESELKKVFE
jgi:hypothetical protein